MKTIAFFNNKGGVGKTTLVYHIAWMMTELGYRVLAADLDPQANLSSMFLEEKRLEELWPEEGGHKSVLACISPILEGTGDIAAAHTERIRDSLYLVPGDLGLSQFEDKLSDSWPRCLDQDPAAFRAITAFYRIVYAVVETVDAEIVLIDVGPNLGAINRSALIAADHVIMPLASDLYSLQGLKNLGPTLRQWRRGWKQRLDQKPENLNIPLPSGNMSPAGYIIMQHVERKNRPVKSYRKWVERIPGVYREFILDQPRDDISDVNNDPHCIGLVRHYQSLMPMAQEARKPVFLLKPADGAIGAHAQAVQKCYMDFKRITETILQRTSP
ncbi:MAG: chromosome partitioning protein [Deltaproteobacteria bacterium]|nr:MAG: chromosome partitioning protein [Deltaproteobacteria bacterium]RLB87426.1 MAG: ParA family protein [Deltaproteobacteria bacterium]